MVSHIGEVELQPDAQPEAKSSLPYEPAHAFRTTQLQDDSNLADCKGKRIGILIVTENAVGTLAKVLKRITPNVWKNVEEVVVFDDASSDATYELAVGIKTLIDLPKLTVLKHPQSRGYGGNQKAGYRYFIDRGFDIVVLLHGDGKYAPEILSHLYHPIVEGKSDAVFGSRMVKDFGGPRKGGMPLYKIIANHILTILENSILGLKLTEFHSGYRAYSVAALRHINFSRMTDDFHFDTEIIVKLNHQRFRISEVPIPTYYGTEIRYVNGITYTKNVVRAIFRYKQSVRSVARYPEFEEYFTHYPIKQFNNSSHTMALAAAGSGNMVLDVGCGKGFFAAELLRSNNQIVGIDALPPSEVLPALGSYFQTELDNGIAEIVAQAGIGAFDRVLLLDVVEHMKDAGRLVEEAKAALKNSGILILSVPNFVNITVRLQLLFGNFKYQERGILDKTHLHWFTRESARRLVEERGFDVIEMRMTNMPVELSLGLAPTGLPMRSINRLVGFCTRLMPSLLGYQIVIIARRSNV